MGGGAKLVDVEVMLSWASSMTWKGLYPILSLSKTVYQKGISLTKKAMKKVESRLQRNPLLPKWDIFIQPLLLVIYFSKITLYGLITWVKYGFRQCKQELDWTDYRFTNFQHIERCGRLFFVFTR